MAGSQTQPRPLAASGEFGKGGGEKKGKRTCEAVFRKGKEPGFQALRKIDLEGAGNKKKKKKRGVLPICSTRRKEKEVPPATIPKKGTLASLGKETPATKGSKGESPKGEKERRKEDWEILTVVGKKGCLMYFCEGQERKERRTEPSPPPPIRGKDGVRLTLPW